jgi:hypothetical protein
MYYVVGKKQQSCWRVLLVPKGYELAFWKGRKSSAWHLMSPDKHLGEQGCNYQFCNQEILNTCKNRSVNIHPSVLFMFNWIWFCTVICCQFVTHYLSVVNHHLASCFAFTFIHPAWSFKICFCFCFVHSVSFDYLLFDYSVLLSVLIR